MKLYANPAGPRRHEFYTASTAPASAYSLLHRLLEAYNEMLYSWWAPEELYRACFGDFEHKPNRAGNPPNARCRQKLVQAIEDRLGYEVPELLERMTPPELEAAAQLLQQQTLVGFIWHVLGQERTIQHRLEEGNCSTRLSDDSHAKAAGFGFAPMVSRPKVKRMQPASKPHAAPTPVLRVHRSPRFWSQVRRKAQLSIWPPVEALGAGVTEAGL